MSIIYVCYVVVFYEGNGDYLDGNGKCFYLMSFGFNFEVKVVLEMIWECRDGGVDDRRFMVEMIVDVLILLDF